MKILVALFVSLVARPSTTGARLPIDMVPRDSDASLVELVPDSGRRELLFLRRSTVCRRVRGSARTYETKTIRRIVLNLDLNNGATPGKCSAVCKQVCEHRPCRADYILEGETCKCTDAEPQSQCGNNTFCSDDKCLCLPGYKGTPSIESTGCSDVDECADGSNVCGANATCTNVQGSYTCSCKLGFEGTPPNCVDTNECADGSNVCGMNATCTNLAGSFACACHPGYEGTPPNCVPDACTQAGRVCGVNAACSNLTGSFACACHSGYEGTPPNCVPDACTKAGQVCGVNTRCNVNNINNPTCACSSLGYARNTTIVNGAVFFCDDVNECLNPLVCAVNQNCFNFPGTFFCGIKAWNTCPSGNDATCSPGLQCAQFSRSDSRIVCCQNTAVCGASKCCNDAYILGENCPSQSNDDCEGNLQCGRTVASPTYKCCANTQTLVGVRYCL